MSMICNLRMVTHADATALLATPEQIVAFLHGSDNVQEEAPPSGLFSRLFGRLARRPPRTAVGSWKPPADDALINLDKAWHGLHCLFTGTAWEGEAPANFLLNGGTEIGAIDVGYGPARLLNTTEVRAFAQFLTSVTEDELRSRYNGPMIRQLGIYPFTTDPEEDPLNLDYLLDYFAILKTFVQRANEEEKPLIIYLD